MVPAEALARRASSTKSSNNRQRSGDRVLSFKASVFANNSWHLLAAVHEIH